MTSLANIQCLCKKCNERKARRTMKEWKEADSDYFSNR